MLKLVGVVNVNWGLPVKLIALTFSVAVPVFETVIVHRQCGALA